MKEGRRATLGRRLFVSFAVLALLGIFLALYYFIYIPQQEVSYNKGAFRVLGEIADNFTERLFGNERAVKKEDKTLAAGSYAPFEFSDTIYDPFKIKQKLSGIEGMPQSNDTAVFESPVLTASYAEGANTDSAKKAITKIFEPVISIHGSTFESVMLIHLEKENVKGSHSGELIYKSSGLAIDEEINIDSLFKKTSAFTFPIVNDVNIEASDYKLYLFPYRIQHEKFLFAGFVSRQNFKAHTHNFPVISLIILGILLISVLLSLPFLKIYLIGPQENISVNDVRSLIAMIYIIPFFLVLLGSGIWLQYTNNIKSTAALQKFHEEVKNNFYNEIKQSIRQLKQYDQYCTDPAAGFHKFISRNIDTSILKNDKVNFTDVYLHPDIYKNFYGIFWINNSGKEIAKWNLTDSLPKFFDKNDRQYYKDIKNNLGYRLPDDTTVFSIQPALSKSTGDYTVNLVIKSAATFTNGKAILIGLHSKMYSVFKPVVPRGANFCIIDENGDILYHSESDRNLQENLFEELDNSNPLKIAVSHKNDLLLDNVLLYQNKVKLLMKPLDGLPYFLVTYSSNKVDLLYIIHIIAFSFLIESLLLVIVSLVSLFYYHSNNKFSKLFFAENDLNFATPSPLKKKYYKRILYYQLAILILMSIAFIFFNGRVLLSYVLYTSILLPLFSVIGYYLIRSVENYKDDLKEEGNMLSRQTNIETDNSIPNNFTEEQSFLQNDTTIKSYDTETQQPKNKWHQLVAMFENRQFLISFLKIMGPYLVLIWMFFIIKNNVSYSSYSAAKEIVNALVVLFTIVFPLMAIYLSLFGLPKWMIVKRTSKGRHKYLTYFVLAIMVSASLTSVMPTLGFILFAAGQEKSLQLKSKQKYLADGLKQHRQYINKEISATKLVSNSAGKPMYAADSMYIDSLKFWPGKGIYSSGHSISLKHDWAYNKSDAFSNSGFYKLITQYLFLPSEHSDYFDNAEGFYWIATPLKSEKKDSLLFYYKNANDNINTSNIVITSVLPAQPSFLSVLNYRLGAIILLVVLLLLLVFYNIIYSASKRIFLIDYFEKTPGAEQDLAYLNKQFFEKEEFANKDFDKAFWGQDKLSLDLIRAKENGYPTVEQKEESILKIQVLLANVYEKIWLSLEPTGQYVLYDFAIDGFSNYKNVDVLYSLYKDGILRKEKNTFVIMTESFRNYLIAKTGTAEIDKLKHEISEGGTWGNLRSVLLIIIFLIIVFLFIVQEDVSKKVLAIVTSVGAAIPIILKLFDRNISGSSTDSSKK